MQIILQENETHKHPVGPTEPNTEMFNLICRHKFDPVRAVDSPLVFDHRFYDVTGPRADGHGELVGSLTSEQAEPPQLLHHSQTGLGPAQTLAAPKSANVMSSVWQRDSLIW